MATRKLRLDLEVLLPDASDGADACVKRLEELLEREPGISDAHVLMPPKVAAPTLCLHYDAGVLSLERLNGRARAAGAQLTERYGHATLPIRVVGAEDIAGRIEQAVRRIQGVLDAAVSLPAQRVRVEFDKSVTSLDAITSAIDAIGLAEVDSTAAGQPAGTTPEPPRSWYSRNQELAWSLASGTLLFAGFAGEKWFGLPSTPAIALYAAAYAFGGYDLARHALASVRKGAFRFDIDLLMLVAATGAGLLGEWAEGAFLLFLFALAHALEHYALDRARNAIRALGELAPRRARVKRQDGREEDVPVEQVAVGAIVIVRPAERIPVDGSVSAGQSAVNQAPITGESVPVEKAVGAEVFAGTVNGDGTLEIATTRAAGDRTLDRIITLVAEAQTQKAPTQQFVERFERVFVPIVLVADALLIIVPPLLGVWTWSVSFYRGMALLVAATPCALAIGTPAAILASIAQAARRGVLIKGGAHLENLGATRALALDKTGTLTIGRPEVIEVTPLDTPLDEVVRITAAVERKSQHPLADAIVRHAESLGGALPEAGDLQSLTARGVRSIVSGKPVEIGGLRLWEELGIDIPEPVRAAVGVQQSAGRSTVVVRHGDKFIGVYGIADRPREGVKQILEQLRALGVSPIIMLSGDNTFVAEAVGKDVGIDAVRANLLPEDKVTVIRELTGKYGRVGMVGDGVNDAPALANATVGIAMGAAGTAAALEAADVALMADDLGQLPFAIGLARQTRRIIRQNLVASMSVIALLVIATTTGIAGMGFAVVVHEGSTLLVVGNALRLLGYSGAGPGVAAPPRGPHA
ncbi:MAG: cadmium-translocating P-type ATPase [Cyanobacteria bacterium]|nr:cadmium-translocating P-type ATPase [Cyanobacteriota bacterium]